MNVLKEHKLVKKNGQRYERNNFVKKAVFINDAETITDKEREAELIKLFKANGLKLEFYN